ncbi:MAG: hypothetical protein ACLFP8_02660 [Alphaproteobacteria bacterium]
MAMGPEQLLEAVEPVDNGHIANLVATGGMSVTTVSGDSPTSGFPESGPFAALREQLPESQPAQTMDQAPVMTVSAPTNTGFDFS